jgi:predicted RNA-binding protein with RPS1 domain
MGAKVAFTVNEFMTKQISLLVPSLPSAKIKVKWVLSPDDPILHKNGSLVLYLRETNDQTRNILTAAHVALPQLVCPTLRPRLQPVFSEAIDLTLLKKLADGLGKHAKPIFQRYFLNPANERNVGLANMFRTLVELDENGIFIPIFLEELNVLGETMYSTGDFTEKSGEVENFLEYLLKEARRGQHEYIRLDYLSRDFKIGLILLAQSVKMEREGVIPYVKRLDQKIKLGCESIYIIAYPPAVGFLEKIMSVIEADNRVTLIKSVAVRNPRSIVASESPKKIVLFRCSPMFSDTDFESKIRAVQIKSGDIIDGTVLDVSRDCALVDIKGFNGVILRTDCSWTTISGCSDILKSESKHKFLVTSIDTKKGLLELSLKFPNEDPWKSKSLPKIKDRIQIKMFSCNQTFYLGSYLDGIEIIIPRSELSWTTEPDLESTELLNTTQEIVIYERIDELRVLKGSVRQLSADPWPEIHKNLPKGTQLRATVIEVSSLIVRVQLPGNLVGIIPGHRVRAAGFEYEHYEVNVLPGQGLDVIVTKVFLAKRKIRLDLARNISK